MNEVVAWPGWNWILLIANIVLTIIAWKSARKSEKYFNKSRNLSIYAKTNKVLLEISNMQATMTEILSISNIKNRKGANNKKRISELGVKLDTSYNMILQEMPYSYYDEFNNQKCSRDNKIDLQRYINSLIDGRTVTEEGIDINEYTESKKTLSMMQEFLKKKILDIEEKLK